MTAFPTSPRSAFLLWCQEHAPVWATNSAAIGLGLPATAAYTAAVTATQNALVAQEAAKQAYRTATETVNDAFGGLRGLTGDAVRSIRSFAEQQTKPLTVYNLAQIPPPAQPVPAPPPGQPTNLGVSLDSSSGNLVLAWKCANPAGTSGTSYIVRRKLPTETQFSFVGVTGTKKFVDQTFFAGPDSVQYTVQAQRADQSGPVSEVFTVNFGRTGGGGFQISSVTGGAGGQPVQMAA
jgi:hypothetical protein